MTEASKSKQSKSAQPSGFPAIGAVLLIMSFSIYFFIAANFPEALAVFESGTLSTVMAGMDMDTVVLFWAHYFAKIGLIVGPLFIIGGGIINAIRKS